MTYNDIIKTMDILNKIRELGLYKLDKFIMTSALCMILDEASSSKGINTMELLNEIIVPIQEVNNELGRMVIR